MSKGYIYVLSNPAMPDLVKVGRSIHGGHERAKQINQTGVPSPFVLEMEMLTDDHEIVESEIHDQLDYCRETENREFFRTDVDSAIASVINSISISHVMRLTESIVDDDTVAELAWKMSKVDIDVHPFVLASALLHLDPRSMMLALSKHKEAGEKRMERLRKAREGDSND